MKYSLNNTKGFTLVELMISVGIFAMMTALLLAKFGTFNQGILLSNLAYDVALTIRNAQSYGLNVKSADRATNVFDYPYGVHFVAGESKFTFFADVNSSGVYDSGDDSIPTQITNIKRGSKILKICLNSDCTPPPTPPTTLDITFKRPDPNALIRIDGGTKSYAKIVLEATDGSIRNIVVRSTGQIAVED